MQHRDIAVAGAFGAGIGTVLAIVFRQYVVLGTLGGALAGALIGGMSFRPLEVARVVRGVLHERWRALVWSVAVSTLIVGASVTYVLYPMVALVSAAVVIGFGIARIGWTRRVEIGRAVLWFIGKALVVSWATAMFLSGAIALPLVLVLLLGSPSWMDSACFIGFVSAIVSILALGMADERFEFSQFPQQRHWSWMLSRRISKFLALGGKRAPFSDSLIPEEWGKARIDGRIFRPRALLELFTMTGIVVLLFMCAPLAIALLCLGVIVDVPVTIALALASSKRIAVMEGAFFGAILGAAAFRAGVLPPVAVLVASAVGAASGVGLYRLRKRLDCTAPATA